MPVVNAEIASELDKIADLLDIEGANPFRVRAYRRAARLIGELPRNITDMLTEGEDLDELPGIGRDLADKIAVIARGEHLQMLDELEREAPAGITALLALPGLGPKRVHLLHENLALTQSTSSQRRRRPPSCGPCRALDLASKRRCCTPSPKAPGMPAGGSRRKLPATARNRRRPHLFGDCQFGSRHTIL